MLLTNVYQQLNYAYLFNSGYGICYEYLDARLTARTTEQLAQDKIDNVTYVDLRQRVAGGSWYSTNCSSTIDGSTVAIPGQVTNSYTRERTVPIPHASDGTAVNITKSAFFYSLWNDAGLGAISCTFSLPPIPKASDVAAPDTFIINNGALVTVTKKVPTYYDILKIYAVGTVDQIGFLVRTINDYTTQTITFTTNELEDIYETIPDRDYVRFFFIVETYSTQGGTMIGEKQKHSIGNISPAYCSPVFPDYVLSDVNAATLALGSYVKQQSSLQVAISSTNKAVAKYNASILRYEVDTGGDIIIANYSTNSINIAVPKIDLISGTIKVSAVDSRGVKTTVQKSITLLNYVLPDVITLDIIRKDGAGEICYLTTVSKIYPTVFTAGTNEVTYAGYRVKLPEVAWDAQTWFDITTAFNAAAYTDASGNVIVNESDALRIYADGSTTDFTFGQGYDVQFKLSDGVNTAVLNSAVEAGVITDGKVHQAHFKDDAGDYHTGYNTLPNKDYNHVFKGTMAQTLDGEIFTPVGIGILDVYPVGSIYLSTVATNPATLFGGTWAAFATGRTLVGIDTSQDEFNTVEKTGGHKLLQAHTHNVFANKVAPSVFSASPNSETQALNVNEGTVVSTFWANAGTFNARDVSTTGGGNAQNLQPYITVYMWKRIA